jgi:hypothetical protein
MFRFRRCHERNAKSRPHQADAVSAWPDLLGDARSDARLGKGRENTVVEPRVIGAGKKHKRRRGEVAQAELGAFAERMVGREEDTISLPQELMRV